MRTQEQIIAQLEARYAELEKTRGDPYTRCKDCKWSTIPMGMDDRFRKCHQPLIKGFEVQAPYAWDCQDGTHHGAKLCGPEKALWAKIEPKPTLLSRIISFIGL